MQARERNEVVMVQLGTNRYGKAEVRVVHVGRGAGPDGSDLVRDWNVSTSLSGDLAATHLTGDNSRVLPTDTQKNTVYALAKKLGGIEPEAFAVELAAHYTGSAGAISRARIGIQEYPWIPVSGTGHSFARSGHRVAGPRVLRCAGHGLLRVRHLAFSVSCELLRAPRLLPCAARRFDSVLNAYHPALPTACAAFAAWGSCWSRIAPCADCSAFSTWNSAPFTDCSALVT
jgi:hypothetical protein